MNSQHGSESVRGITLLERTSEDEAAGIYRVQAPGGATAHLTERQVEIMSLSEAEKHHVPFTEQVELGKVMMNLQQANVDALLREIDENPSQAPEFVPEPYEYTPLKKPNSLRLLQIFPESEDGMIQISLDEHDLDEHIPSYYCLSYCWNNPHGKSNTFDMHTDMAEDYDDQSLYPIACNGRLLYVRGNLYDALKQLPAAPGLQLKQWYNFNGTTEKFTGLHVAAAEGDVALTKTNIFRGAQIDTKDSKGRTALGLAVINGHLPVVRTLLEAGSDPQTRDYAGQTCLDYALSHDRHEVTEYLLTFNPDNIKQTARKNKHVGRGVKTWIDAICINQNDLEEKNEQVSVMDRIYSQAFFVTVWLGRDDGTGRFLSDVIYKLYSVASRTKTLGEVDFEPYKVTDPETCQNIGMPYISGEEWISLAALYLRQYFRRIWCLQEAVLREDVVMYLGEHHVPWDEFMMVTEQLHMVQRRYTISPSSKFRPSYTAAIESEAHLISELRMRRNLDNASSEQRKAWFQHTGRFWRGEGQKCQIPLLEMVLSTVTFDCSDPRDHIYGLMGMCKDHPESPEIQVDYTKPWEEVYTDVMRLCLHTQADSNIKLLTLIRDSANYKNENLPSWVLHFGQAGISPFWQPHYAAAGDFSDRWDVALSSDGRENELILEGKRIDIIKEVATKRPGAEQVSFCNLDTTWPLLILSLPQTYPHTKETRTEVLWRTLCGDSPSLDDIEMSRRNHARTTESTSAEPLSIQSKAPSKYSAQFRLQLLAMILSHAEKQADWRLKLRNTQGGVLLQAMMSLQLARDSNDDESSVHRIYKPSEEELINIRDTSLEGPYFSDPTTKQAIEGYELLYQTDSRQNGGPGCSTPSRAGIAAFLDKPKFRIWYPNGDNTSQGANITRPAPRHAGDTQISDSLPPEEDGFRTQFTRFNGGRRLFTTQHYQYLGLGGMSMQLGDEVWVVKGSKVPLLLRKLGEEEIEDIGSKVEEVTSTTTNDKGKGKELPRRRCYYKLIGDLYVHGMMYGEALTCDSSWEDIALC